MKSLTGIGKQNMDYFSPLLMGIGEDEGILLIGLIEDGKAVGALAASVSDGYAALLHLFVAEDARGRGNGRFLLQGFLSSVREAGLMGVSVFYPCNEALDSLFAGEGFLVVPGNELCVMEVGSVLGSSQIKKLRDLEPGNDVKPLSALSPVENAALFTLLNGSDVSGEDFLVLSPDRDLSSVVIRNKKAEAVLLVRKQEEQCLIQLLLSGSDSGTANLTKLLSRLTTQIFTDPEIEELAFHPDDQHVLRFAETLAEDKKKVKRVAYTNAASLSFEGTAVD